MNSKKIADAMLAASLGYLQAIKTELCQECEVGLQRTFDITNGQPVTRVCPACGGEGYTARLLPISQLL